MCLMANMKMAKDYRERKRYVMPSVGGEMQKTIIVQIISQKAIIICK